MILTIKCRTKINHLKIYIHIEDNMSVLVWSEGL